MTDWTDHHPYPPAVSFDGGDLDCGNGLLLLIRKHIDPLDPGQLWRSCPPSLRRGGPAGLVPADRQRAGLANRGTGPVRSYLVCKGASRRRSPCPGRSREFATARPARTALREPGGAADRPAPSSRSRRSPSWAIGSWPRPGWLLRALHEHLAGRLGRGRVPADADDAVRLAVAAQERAGVDVVTDGEQRRDNYASFVGGRLDNCQLIPITDLLALRRGPGRVRRGAAGPRRAGRPGPPPGRVRAGSGGRGRWPPTSWPASARMTAQAGEGGPARPVPAHPDDVAGVRLRQGVPGPRGAGRATSCAVLREEARGPARPAGPASCSSTSRC